MATNKGKENGAIQNNYKGTLSVYWQQSILENSVLKNVLSENLEVKNSDDIDFRNKFKAKYRTKSGHYVRSRAEVIIADWLYTECIAFAYERRLPIEEDAYCDFYIPKYKIYIEFWGLEENQKYAKRKAEKIEIYKRENFKLIEIDNNTINNIDDILPKELLKFGVRF